MQRVRAHPQKAFLMRYKSHSITWYRWNNLKNLDWFFSEMFYENQILFKSKLFKCFEVLF